MRWGTTMLYRGMVRDNQGCIDRNLDSRYQISTLSQMGRPASHKGLMTRFDSLRVDHLQEDIMAVQFADKALDDWLSSKIDKLTKEHPKDLGDVRYISALKDARRQLHNFWGAKLEE